MSLHLDVYLGLILFITGFIFGLSVDKWILPAWFDFIDHVNDRR